MVFVLSNQSFPACFPAGGEGNCLKIIRLEDGSLSDLTAVFLETVANYAIPAGSVVLIHSLSYLTWVEPAAYAEEPASGSVASTGPASPSCMDSRSFRTAPTI